MGQVNCKCEKQTNKRHVQDDGEIYFSVNQLQKRLQIFALQHKLMIYPVSARKVIQQLYILRQQSLCLVIIDLLKQKKKAERQLLIKDILRIDLEEFDNIFHQSSIQQTFKPKKQSKKKIEYCWQFTQQMKKQGQKCIINQNVLLIVTINCFQNQNCLQPINLPSKKNPFQIFLQKIQGMNQRYSTFLKVLIITNQKQINKENYNLPQNTIVVPYSPQFPCFSNKGKIASFGHRIIFPQKQGDIISFILHDKVIKQTLENVDYISFSNIKNLVQPAIDIGKLGYLIMNRNQPLKKDVLLQIYSIQPKIHIQNQFLNIGQQNIGNCLMTKQFLLSINGKNADKFIQKIKKQKTKQYKNLYFFNRNLCSIFLSQSTVVNLVDQFAYQVVKYSQYCQKLLGIQTSSKDQQYIQIDPQILYGPPEQIQKIIQELKNTQNIGFPIIILKSKQTE